NLVRGPRSSKEERKGGRRVREKAARRYRERSGSEPVYPLIFRSAAGLFAALLIGCGYPGEPLPPALKRPVRIVDLNAVERGSKIIIHFTIPAITTEGAPVKGPEPLDVRIGPAPAGRFDINAWGRDARRIPESEIKRNPPIASI